MGKGDHNRKLSPAQIDEIVRRYTTRLPDGTWEGVDAVAKDFGVARGTVRRWLGLRGVQLRSAREAHSGGKRCKPVKNLPQGEAPPCKCGCDETVAWNQRMNRWNRYVTGHYRRPAPYKDETWLRAEYITKRRPLHEIATECGVNKTTVSKFMRQFGIEIRDASEAHLGLMAGPLNPNWKGGVAKWPYAPDWQSLARRIRYRDNWTCQDCKKYRSNWGIYLHVHHIDENKFNNDPENLISLCAQCHRNRHRRTA